MEKIVVVSTNNNPDYYFYSPYIRKAWNKLGWKLAVMVTHDVDITNIDADYTIQLPNIPELRDATVAQAGRLYAANYFDNEPRLLMTSDMDLLPLSDYWTPDLNAITVYGHDLTDYSYYPMGYVAMSTLKWKQKLNLTGDTKADMLRDANETQIAFSPEWEKWWNFDWDLLTKRLKPTANEITFITRGRRKDAGFAFGRIDRGDSMKIIEKPWIDAHCENHNVQHPDKLNRFLEIFESVYGKL